jgi:hypothetical protein
MTQTNNSASQPALSLTKRMLVGAAIGLVLILFFLIGAEANPAWGKFWMIRPLIIVPLAGAMAGLCNYYLIHFRSLIGISKTVAIAISVVVSLIGLWMGVVVGLDGTMWD